MSNAGISVSAWGKASRAAGFTLIELVIVIVIVGILASIALPAYQDSLRKGRRADAKAGLMDAANRMERYMLDRSKYTKDMRELGFGADPMLSEEGYYNIDVDETATATVAACGTTTLATALNTCYVLKATPVAGGIQAEDTKCTSFTLRSTGAKSATGPSGDDCW